MTRFLLMWPELFFSIMVILTRKFFVCLYLEGLTPPSLSGLPLKKTLFWIICANSFRERNCWIVKSMKVNQKLLNLFNSMLVKGKIPRPTDIQTDRQTDKQTDRQTDKPTDRQTLLIIEKLHFQKYYYAFSSSCRYFCLLTGVSYKWYASVEGLPNLYSVIDG